MTFQTSNVHPFISLHLIMSSGGFLQQCIEPVSVCVMGSKESRAHMIKYAHLGGDAHVRDRKLLLHPCRGTGIRGESEQHELLRHRRPRLSVSGQPLLHHRNSKLVHPRRGYACSRCSVHVGACQCAPHLRRWLPLADRPLFNTLRRRAHSSDVRLSVNH